ANNANSYKWAPQGDIITFKDSISFEGNALQFYHRNRANTVFDVTVKQQKMESVKDQMLNPIANLTFGGQLSGENLKVDGTYTGIYQDTDFKGFQLSSKKSAKKHEFQIQLHTNQSTDAGLWKKELQKQALAYKKVANKAEKNTIAWWNKFWNRSFIYMQ